MLVIRQAYSEDEGEYKCVAQNSIGKCERKCQLSVKSKHDFKRFEAKKITLIEITEDEEKPSEPSTTPEAFPEKTPHFVQALKPITIKCGDVIQMEAIIEGVPKPKIYWFHEKRKIRNSRYVQIDQQESIDEVSKTVRTKSILKIANASHLDNGKYTIRAINRNGVKSSSANLVIKGEVYDYFKHNINIQKITKILMKEIGQFRTLLKHCTL